MTTSTDTFDLPLFLSCVHDLTADAEAEYKEVLNEVTTYYEER